MKIEAIIAIAICLSEVATKDFYLKNNNDKDKSEKRK